VQGTVTKCDNFENHGETKAKQKLQNPCVVLGCCFCRRRRPNKNNNPKFLTRRIRPNHSMKLSLLTLILTLSLLAPPTARARVVNVDIQNDSRRCVGGSMAGFGVWGLDLGFGA